MQPDILSDAALLELLQALIRIPSVNPRLAPDHADGEAAVAEFAAAWLAERGLKSRLDWVAPGRPNVVAEVGGADGPTLVFCAHIDTVGTAGMTIPPFEPRVKGRRVYGRGAYDMKGGVAAAMAAGAALVDTDLAGKVLVALVVDEEHSSIGADAFVSHYDADACIVTEPTEGRVILTHKGFVWSKLVTRGNAAHGSRWDLGISAIGKMGRIVDALERFDREALRRRTHPQLGPASLHCATIAGGVGISTYAPDCTLQVERRTLPGETIDEVARELRDAVAAAGESAEVEPFFERSPLVCDPSTPIARCVRQAHEKVTGTPAEMAGVGYWTDAAVFDAAGITALLYGPAGEGAHGVLEWVDLDSVTSCAKVLVTAALDFCQTLGS